MNAPWVLPSEFDLRLTFTSDWHVGSGAGRLGLIDRLVTRDEDDLPFVPAKTLTGIWRDACERLAVALDGKHGAAWQNLVLSIFGDQPALPTMKLLAEQPTPALLSIRPLHLGMALRRALRQSPLLREAMTFVQPGVKIDSKTGRAEERHLRFVEMVRQGTCLESTCHIEVGDDSRRPFVSAILLAGAKLVERLGGKRRRGAGECRLDVMIDKSLVVLAAVLDWLEKAPLPGPTPASTRRVSSVPAPATGTWVKVPLKLTCVTPVAIHARTVGNVVESLDFIPGTYLLPHVTATFRKLGVADPRAAIAAGDLRVLPATIEVGSGAGRPIPFSCHELKHASRTEKKDIRNLLVEQKTEDPQLKQCRKEFVGVLQGSVVVFDTVKPTVRTHNTVDDKKQRPTEDAGGGVYSYEAIKPGTVLHTEVRVRRGLLGAPADADWVDAFNGKIRVGRSSKDDYGLIEVQAGGASDLTAVARNDRPAELSVWLLSDALLRGSGLGFDASVNALQTALADRLKVKLELLGAFARVRRIESWQVGWGLPRPTLVGLQAGTCLRFKLESGPLDPAILADIEAGGIGERTVEGYGQVCFNDPLLARARFEMDVPLPRPKPADLKVPAADPSHAVARTIETAAWREMIHRAALGFGGNPTLREQHFKWRGHSPTVSQLGSLREAVMQVVRREDRSIFSEWIKAVRENKKRARRWPAGALDALSELATNDNTVWDRLKSVEHIGGANDEWPTLTENASSTLKSELWPLALRTLIDEAIRGHKRGLDHAAAKKGD